MGLDEGEWIRDEAAGPAGDQGTDAEELRATTRAAGGLAVEVIFPPPAGDGRRAEGRVEALV